VPWAALEGDGALVRTEERGAPARIYATAPKKRYCTSWPSEIEPRERDIAGGRVYSTRRRKTRSQRNKCDDWGKA
jgi:hypothetical protein